MPIPSLGYSTILIGLMCVGFFVTAASTDDRWPFLRGR